MRGLVEPDDGAVVAELGEQVVRYAVDE